jgi:RimJ/RimL family protein N-acetyltransferase
VTEVILTTERLLLRIWADSDREPLSEMNADPQVMEFFPALLTRSESDSLVDSFVAEQADRGFCPWAAHLRESSQFIGFVGLHVLPDYLPAAPGVEVGWRLARRFWGNGYATEAATASVGFGFASLGLNEIVSMTSVVNIRSRHVMERLGMTHDPSDDFEHPRIPRGDILRPHVLYRLVRGASRFDSSLRFPAARPCRFASL